MRARQPTIAWTPTTSARTSSTKTASTMFKKSFIESPERLRFGDSRARPAVDPSGVSGILAPMKRFLAALVVMVPALARAEVQKHGGSPDPVPHDKYVRVVSETDSPLQQAYVK